eukprot:752736-Hanusia_phi.AAC.7
MQIVEHGGRDGAVDLSKALGLWRHLLLSKLGARVHSCSGLDRLLAHVQGNSPTAKLRQRMQVRGRRGAVDSTPQ